MASNLMITAINARKAERVALTSDSQVNLHRAMASSGSLPGVWRLRRLRVTNILMVDVIPWRMQI